MFRNVGVAAALLRRPPPAWATSDFLQTLAPATSAFSPRFMAVWVAPGLLPGALSRYETPAERAIARRTAALEWRCAQLEAREEETWASIMSALALWP